MGPVQLLRAGREYLRDGRTMEARVLALKGAGAFPEFTAEFRLLLTDGYLAEEDWSKARDVLVETLASHPDDQRIRTALGALNDRAPRISRG